MGFTPNVLYCIVQMKTLFPLEQITLSADEYVGILTEQS